jgi:hypothetical protein
MALIFGDNVFSYEAAERYLCLSRHGASCLALKYSKAYQDLAKFMV